MKIHLKKILYVCFTLCLSKPTLASQPLLHKSIEYLAYDLDKAESTIEKVLRKAPDNAEAYFICGKIMGRQAENAVFFALSYASKSLSCLKKAIEIDPNNEHYRMGLLSFYLGAPSIAGGDNMLAKKQVEEIFKLDALTGSKANVKYLMATEQQELLSSSLIKYIKLYPNEAEFHFRYGLLMQSQENYQSAYAAFKLAVETNEVSTFRLNAIYQIGRNAVLSGIYIQEGVEMLLAYSVLHKKNENTPPLEWAHLRLAQLYAKLSNKSLMAKYADLASQSKDRDLHRALKKIEKGE